MGILTPLEATAILNLWLSAGVQGLHVEDQNIDAFQHLVVSKGIVMYDDLVVICEEGKVQNASRDGEIIT